MPEQVRETHRKRVIVRHLGQREEVGTRASCENEAFHLNAWGIGFDGA